MFQVNQNIARQGYVSARGYLEETCDSTSFVGYLLGFIWGIQYSHDAPTECFTNIEYTLMAINEVVEFMYYILLPDKWGDFIINWQVLVDLTSSGARCRRLRREAGGAVPRGPRRAQLLADARGGGAAARWAHQSGALLGRRQARCGRPAATRPKRLVGRT